MGRIASVVSMAHQAILSLAIRAQRIRDQERAQQRAERGHTAWTYSYGSAGVDPKRADARRRRRGRRTQDDRGVGKPIRKQLADLRSIAHPSWLLEKDPKVRRKERNAAKRRRQGR